MAGDRYYINDQHNTYFLTLTVVDWLDVFTRPVYKDTIVNSLTYCIKEKGLVLNAWVLMSNHLHLVGRCNPPHRMSDFLRDFKKFTSKKIYKDLQNTNESRSSWLLDRLRFRAKIAKNEDVKLWQDGNHAIDLNSYQIDIVEKINYIHQNPVRSAIVSAPEYYLYSSAIDYAIPYNKKGLIEIELV